MDESAFPALLAHTVRKDWGVGVVAEERDGRRRYLFEDGAERVLADGFYQMMQPVEKPNADQQAAYTRLRGVLAKRNHGGSAKALGASFFDQLVTFHKHFPEGLTDPRWRSDVRGEGATTRLAKHRQALLVQAREQLSSEALDTLIAAQQFGRVWDALLGVLRQSDLVPAAQLKLKAPASEHLRPIAVALRELLHGTGPQEQRFDRFVAAFVTTFGQHPKWELATAPSALIHPTDHVCVEPASFRKQHKLNGTSRPIASQPSSGAYQVLLNSARVVANKLAEQGEVPRDLFDVRDFIVVTLRPAAKPRGPRTTASPDEA